MARRNRVALASENYFSGNALVCTLDRACGHSQEQEPTQFLRVVQLGLSPLQCPYPLPVRSPHRRVRFQAGTIFDPDFGPWRALRGILPLSNAPINRKGEISGHAFRGV